jgi:hypothetical protein
MFGTWGILENVPNLETMTLELEIRVLILKVKIVEL